ncbi:MAG: transcriptional activator RfaH [Acidobacteria bacterium]|nr:transcriptional activator RfaH [Acidobacteriota bacterium]
MEIGQDTGEFPDSQCSWYAIRTRSNYEKIAARVLEARGFEHYLPLYGVRKRWSDRVVETKIPLFAGYLFCKFDVRRRWPILSTPGVASIVSYAGKPATISDLEIEAIQTVLSCGRRVEPCPYLVEGQLIQVNRGPLKGLQGILIKKLNYRIVISIQMLRRSLAVEIDPDCITPVWV